MYLCRLVFLRQSNMIQFPLTFKNRSVFFSVTGGCFALKCLLCSNGVFPLSLPTLLLSLLLLLVPAPPQMRLVHMHEIMTAIIIFCKKNSFTFSLCLFRPKALDTLCEKRPLGCPSLFLTFWAISTAGRWFHVGLSTPEPSYFCQFSPFLPMNKWGSYWLKFMSMKAKTAVLRHPWGQVQRILSEDSREGQREVCPP